MKTLSMVEIAKQLLSDFCQHQNSYHIVLAKNLHCKMNFVALSYTLYSTKALIMYQEPK